MCAGSRRALGGSGERHLPNKHVLPARPLLRPNAGEKLSESGAADVRQLCDTLLNSYLIQLLDTGFLHADPVSLLGSGSGSELSSFARVYPMMAPWPAPYPRSPLHSLYHLLFTPRLCIHCIPDRLCIHSLMNLPPCLLPPSLPSTRATSSARPRAASASWTGAW
jgi:hypothetical protein